MEEFGEGLKDLLEEIAKGKLSGESWHFLGFVALGGLCVLVCLLASFKANDLRKARTKMKVSREAGTADATASPPSVSAIFGLVAVAIVSAIIALGFFGTASNVQNDDCPTLQGPPGAGWKPIPINCHDKG